MRFAWNLEGFGPSSHNSSLLRQTPHDDDRLLHCTLIGDTFERDMMWTYRGPEAQRPALLGHRHEHDPGEASPSQPSPPEQSQPSPPEPSQPSQPSPGKVGARLGKLGASPGGMGASPGPGDPDHPDDPGGRNPLVLVSDGSRETLSDFWQFEDAVSRSQVQNQTDVDSLCAQAFCFGG